MCKKRSLASLFSYKIDKYTENHSTITVDFFYLNKYNLNENCMI